MTLCLRLAGVALAMILAGPIATALSSPQPSGPSVMPDVDRLGPQVGERVPDFTLPDQQGKARTRTSLSGPKGLMLVFSRSADW